MNALINASADLNIQDNLNQTALIEGIFILNTKYKNLYLYLFQAIVHNNSPHIALSLIHANASLNLQENQGKTALILGKILSYFYFQKVSI